MKGTLIIFFLVIVLKTTGQIGLSLKTDAGLYLYSVDSMVKCILTKEKPALINLLAEEPILNTFPDSIQGIEITKLKKIRKLKEQANSFYIYIGKLGGTATADKRSVYLRVLKCTLNNWDSWNGVGGFNFDYIFDFAQNTFSLQGITKSYMIR